MHTPLRQWLNRSAREESRATQRCLAILEQGQGHARTRREKACVDASGEEIPWYTYPAIEHLRGLDFAGCNVFEFGSGNSTLFWGRRAKRVVSVENDAAWHARVGERVPGLPIELQLHVEPERYVAAIRDAGGPFDVVIVDGRWRYTSAKAALQHLGAGGLVILDNSDWYPGTAAMLRAADLIQVDFSGFGPINDYTWTTLLFLHRQCRLRPRAGRQPLPAVGSLPDQADDDGPIEARPK